MDILKKKDKAGAELKKLDNSARLKQIIGVLAKHDMMKPMTPEKLVEIIQDLGPTFIKMGQIMSMRSDILPLEYCQALSKLQSNVPPMPYETVREIIEESFGHSVEEVFGSFDQEALGSASIGQVHRATLRNGQEVVVKVQRPGIHATMSRDIALLKHAVLLSKFTAMGSVVDFGQVLDEMWISAQEEMNYLTEAENLEKFRELNEDVRYVTSPKLYREYTTRNVLTMEYCAGYSLRKKDEIVAAGYDLKEIATKLADNYIKQVMEDGFFHADPHPGNIHIREGKIVWMDMGMMGKVTEKERKLINRIVIGMAQNNVHSVTLACLRLGEFHGETDKRALQMDVEKMCDKYGSETSLANISLSGVISDVVEVMKRHNASLPGDLTMLVRGLLTVEGVVEGCSPEVDVIGIASARISAVLIKEFDWHSEIRQDLGALADSARKAISIPGLVSDMLTTIMTGDTKMGMDIHMGKDTSNDMNNMVMKFCAAIICAALLMFSGLFAKTGPFLGDFPVFSLIGFVIAVVMAIYVFLGKPSKPKK